MSFSARFSRSARTITATITATDDEAKAAQTAINTIVAHVTLEELELLAKAVTMPAIKTQAVEQLRKYL